MRSTIMRWAAAGAGRVPLGGLAGAAALLAVLNSVGCASPSRDQRHQTMTAVAHERAAEIEARRALQAGQVTPSSAMALSDEASHHRQAAEILRCTAAEACPAPAMESEGVFSLVSSTVLYAQPVQERGWSSPPRPLRSGPPARLAGALVVVSTLLPAEDVAAGLQCQVARARVNGGHPADPAAVPGVSVRVRQSAQGTVTVELHIDDEAAAEEVLRRAQALAAH